MELSKTNSLVVFAFEKGYKVIGLKIFNPKGFEIKISDNYKGYPKINISINRKTHTLPIHKLVAYQKFGESMFKKGIQVRHLNGDKYDFSISNIEIGTQSQNRRDIPISTRKQIGYVINLKKRKLSFEDAEEIRKNYFSLKMKYGFIKKMALKYNVSDSAIKNLIKNKTYLR
jgi:hypothetical protein